MATPHSYASEPILAEQEQSLAGISTREQLIADLANNQLAYGTRMNTMAIPNTLQMLAIKAGGKKEDFTPTEAWLEKVKTALSITLLPHYKKTYSESLNEFSTEDLSILMQCFSSQYYNYSEDFFDIYTTHFLNYIEKELEEPTLERVSFPEWMILVLVDLEESTKSLTTHIIEKHHKSVHQKSMSGIERTYKEPYTEEEATILAQNVLSRIIDEVYEKHREALEIAKDLFMTHEDLVKRFRAELSKHEEESKALASQIITPLMEEYIMNAVTKIMEERERQRQEVWHKIGNMYKSFGKK